MIAAISFCLLIIALISQVILILIKKRDPISPFLLAFSALLLITETVIRSIQIGFPALTNTFEGLIFFSAMINLVLFIYYLKMKDKTITYVLFFGTMVSFILLALASSPVIPKEVKPPIPALQSAWLILHVTLSFIGEAFFAFSFAVSIYYIVIKDEEKKKEADRLIYRAIALGYPIFGAGGLIFGAIWAQYAWGRFWSWDPKETFALLTWLVYTLYLHLRLVKKVKTVTTVIVAIIGFLFTLFTFLGVNYLLPGLHSY